MAEKRRSRYTRDSTTWPTIKRVIVSVVAFAALMTLLVGLGLLAGSWSGF